MRPNMHSKLSHQSLVYCLLLSFYGTDANHYGKQEFKIVSGSCSNNERFLQCGSDCGHTCDDIGRKDLKCKASHCTKGCFCEPGFYRDFKRQGQCVRALDCQALTPRWASTAISGVKCPPNQEFKCGSNCGRNCDDIGKRVSCPESCESGCYCRDGYYRESSFKSECVKEKYCKKKIQKKLNSKKKEFTLWFKRHIPWKS